MLGLSADRCFRACSGHVFLVVDWLEDGWYIDIDNQVLSSSDNADGSRTYHVQTTFANTATSDIIETAGDYISGYLDGFDRDNLYPELYIYAPSGGSISTLEASNGAEFVEAEHEVCRFFMPLDPTCAQASQSYAPMR